MVGSAVVGPVGVRGSPFSSSRLVRRCTLPGFLLGFLRLVRETAGGCLGGRLQGGELGSAGLLWSWAGDDGSGLRRPFRKRPKSEPAVDDEEAPRPVGETKQVALVQLGGLVLCRRIHSFWPEVGPKVFRRCLS